MEKFVQKVNLKLVKKGRKYWTVIQHWKGLRESNGLLNTLSALFRLEMNLSQRLAA